MDNEGRLSNRERLGAGRLISDFYWQVLWTGNIVDIVFRIARARPEGRFVALNAGAWWVGQLVAAGEFDEQQGRDYLLCIAEPEELAGFNREIDRVFDLCKIDWEKQVAAGLRRHD